MATNTQKSKSKDKNLSVVNQAAEDIKNANKISLPNGIKPYVAKKGEEYMSEGQKQHFTLILETMRSNIIAEASRTIEHLQNEPINAADLSDRATREEEFTLELRARDRERRLLKKIEQSLREIEENDYGFCLDCGTDIGILRLEARPTAQLCIHCKTLSEVKEKQTGLSR